MGIESYIAWGSVATLIVVALVVLFVFFRRRPTTNTIRAYLNWDSDGAKETYTITKRTTRIGRNKTNDLVLGYHSISGFHATLVKESNGHFYIVDNNSRNHVYVDDSEVTKHQLEEGTVFTIGPLSLRFTFQPQVAGLQENTATSTVTPIGKYKHKRKTERIPISVMVRYCDADTGWKRGMATNISAGGMYIETNDVKVHHHDGNIEVTFPAQESGETHWLRFTGKVMHRSERGIGISFEGLDSAAKQLLNKLAPSGIEQEISISSDDSAGN